MAFGALDRKRQKRFERATKRRRDESERLERKAKRKKEKNATLSSEFINDPDADRHSSNNNDEGKDPSWTLCEEKEKAKPETIQLTLKQKEWMKATIIACDRGDISNDMIFHILSTLLVSNGVDLNDVIISPSIISQLRREVQLETDSAIKASFEFPEFLQLHFDGKKREDVTTGEKKEYVSIAVTGPGMETKVSHGSLGREWDEGWRKSCTRR